MDDTTLAQQIAAEADAFQVKCQAAIDANLQLLKDSLDKNQQLNKDLLAAAKAQPIFVPG